MERVLIFIFEIYLWFWRCIKKICISLFTHFINLIFNKKHLWFLTFAFSLKFNFLLISITRTLFQRPRLFQTKLLFYWTELLNAIRNNIRILLNSFLSIIIRLEVALVMKFQIRIFFRTHGSDAKFLFGKFIICFLVIHFRCMLILHILILFILLFTLTTTAIAH